MCGFLSPNELIVLFKLLIKVYWGRHLSALLFSVSLFAKNKTLDKTFIYSYNEIGNITALKE